MRKKNALTKYYIGEASGETAELWLAKHIRTVNAENNEDVSEEAFYDGDGTVTKDIVGIQKGYTFEGDYNADDEAQEFIAALEFETGDARKVWFKQERTDGMVLEGLATVTDISTAGGEASEFATFGCTITWDSKPKITKSGTEGEGGLPEG